MSTATICDFCDQRITDQRSGPDGGIKFNHMAGGDREIEYLADTVHFHRRCLDSMRAGEHRSTSRHNNQPVDITEGG